MLDFSISTYQKTKSKEPSGYLSIRHCQSTKTHIGTTKPVNNFQFDMAQENLFHEIGKWFL